MNINNPTKEQIFELRHLWTETFGDSETFLNQFFSTAFHPDRCRCVTIENEIIAALYWFDCSYQELPIAYIYAVATAKTYRRQGICHKLMADTHLHLNTLGYKGVLLVPANEPLFTFYKNLGYETCCYLQKFSCMAANNPISIRRIAKTEYASLRKKFLPQNAVIQEKENLDFLETQAELFAGENFLLTAYKKDDILYGIELLGNPKAAPEITAALGCGKGHFRIPGKEIPFAMYYPLEDSHLKPPTYFGLGFD